jgi:hypothetical protein
MMPAERALVVAPSAADLPTQARACVITDEASARAAAELLTGVKALRAEIADTFDKHIAAAFAAHKALLKEKRDAEAPAVEAESILKAAIVAWDTAREAAAERERIRLNAIAAEAAAEETRAAAAMAMAAGDDVLAAEILATPIVPVQAIVPTRRTSTVAGVAVRETWYARVVDFAALVQAAARDPQYLGLLEPDVAALDALARALRDRFRVPGVSVIRTKGVSATGRR